MRYVVLNILTAVETGLFDAILHQTNCLHMWNSGLAPQIKEKYPQAFAADLLTRYGNTDKLGTFTVSVVETTTRNTCMILNCYGQYKNCAAGGRTDYDALRRSLESAAAMLPKGSRIGFPKIGCGAAGGDWNIVSKMINEIFQDFVVTICVSNNKEIPSDGTI